MSSQKRCNMCGKPLDFWDKQEDFSLERHFGYGTIYDTEYLNLHLCCQCMERIIGECVINPVSEHIESVIDERENTDV